MNYRTLSLPFVVLLFFSIEAYGWVAKPVDDDHLVRLPGTQPTPTAIVAAPSHEAEGGVMEDYACINCHRGGGEDGMPFTMWQGSMMAQSARDPIFWATMTVAAQDSIWAVGRPNATDICLRCHFPEGWMSDRSDELNASAMTGSDYDGVHCGICHKMYDPFAQETNAGTREGSANMQAYWDEATLFSSTAADITAAADSVLAQTVNYFTSSFGSLFDTNGEPKEPGYTENGAGQMYMDLVSGAWDNMRGPFADPAGDLFFGGAHEIKNIHYSRYHKSKYFCGTCHDVSNPVLANLSDNPLGKLTTELNSPSSYSHVERTFSEFMSSAYSQDNGIPTNQEFQNLGGVAIAGKCQDCHMPKINGVSAVSGPPLAQGGKAVVRPDESVEHSNSGVSSHDMMGGNMWMTRILASLDEGLGTIYDTTNLGLLDQGSAVLTLDLTQGISYTSDSFGTSLLNASERAKANMLRAATIKNVVYNSATGKLSFRVQNNTAHKLLTGYPEGRRMWLNIKAYSDQDVVYEVNPYDDLAGTFKGGLSFWNYNGDDGFGGTVVPNPSPLGIDEIFSDELLYEAVTKSSLTGEDHTFHFALADDRYKDNRIPPKFFDLAEAQTRLCEPVASGGIKDSTATIGSNLYTEAENAGGYDAVTLTIPNAPAKNITHVDIALYYQGTSREYVEFLRDEINGTNSNRALFGPDNIINGKNQTFFDATAAAILSETPNGDNAYLIQSATEPSATFFSALRAWGNTIWKLWYHNHGLDGTGTSIEGVSPFMMTSAQVTAVPAATYTIELSGDGTGQITDTVSTAVICDKPSAAPVSCVIGYEIGSSIDYTAIPGGGSSFGGYTASATINGTQLTDTVTADETIQAFFYLTVPGTVNVIYTLEMLGDGLGYIEDTATKTVLCNKNSKDARICSLKYPVGTTLNFTAVAGAHSGFSGYSGDATFTNRQMTDTTSVDETIQVTFTSGMNMALRAAISIAAEKGNDK